MDVSVLGPISVDGGSVALAPRDRVVLAALSSRLGDEVPSEQLADALWGEDPPASWSKVVPGCVMRLRRVLGVGAIQTTAVGYRLVPEDVDVDARHFEQLVARGHELLIVGEPDRAAHTFARALAMWRGQPYSDVEDWDPARIAATALEELRLETEEALVGVGLQSGDLWEVLGEAQARVAEAPLRERRWALLAEAQYRDGRQGDALRTLRQARRTLVDELGLDPGPELVELERAILQQDPALLTGSTYREPSADCPYFGLVAADVGDAELYFGRDEELAACLRSLAEVGVLVLAGPSGIGKSSMARAGLAATLRRNGRVVTVITPGGHPNRALAAVPRPTGPCALVVDQCEEALLLCDDVEEQQRFFTGLAEYAERGLLVLALRADRLGEIAGFPEFARLVERNLHLLGPMSEADLRAVIERPARQSGLLLEPGLVDLLVRDAAGEPGALPLLSHALRQTWLRREGRTLTVDGYIGTGGIQGSVAQSAEEVYHELSVADRTTLRDLMLRLIDPASDGEPVRLRVPRRLVTADAGRDQLVERLVDARLLTSDDGVVEMAHEALARNWPRLKVWLDEDVEGQRILRHLSMSAASWQSMGRPGTELYRGARLAAALAWREGVHPRLTGAEQEFLDASAAHEEAELAATQAQLRRERRSVVRLRWLGAVVTALAVLAAGASSVATEQRQKADERSTVAEARRVAARALVERPYDRSLLLGVEAMHLWDSPETRGNLLNTIQRSPLAAAVIRSEGARVLGLEAAPDGRHAAVLDNLEDITIYDLADRVEQAHLGAERTSYLAPTYSPDGTRVAASWMNVECWIGDCTDFGLRLFDAADLSAAGPAYEGLGSPAAGIAFAPAGDLIAAIAPLPWTGPQDNVAIWQVDHPEQPLLRLSMREVGDLVSVTPDRGMHMQGWLEFSPDGTELYAGGAGPTVVFDVATGRPLRTLGGRGALAISPDGQTIAVAAADHAVHLLDTATGKVRTELVGHAAAVLDATFSEDGTRVATASTDQTAAVWDASDGLRLQVLRGHRGTVNAVDFVPGSGLYTAGSDAAIIRWDLLGELGLARVVAEPGPFMFDSGTPPLTSQGSTVLYSDESGFAVLDTDSDRLTPLQDPDVEVAWAAFNRDGSRLATVGPDGSVRVWNSADGAVLSRAPGRGASNEGAIAFTADGAQIVVADADGWAHWFDAETLEPDGSLYLDMALPGGVRTAPGGIIAVTGSSPEVAPTEVVFADLGQGRVVRRQVLDTWMVRANFSPDGQLYGFGGNDGAVGVVDVATGETVRGQEPVHGGPVAWVAISADGTTLASVGFDGQVTLSDTADAVPFARLDSDSPSQSGSAIFEGDGHTLRLAYADGTVLRFETDPQAWASHACAVAGRNLTRAEWQDAFGDRPYRTTCPEYPAG